MSLNHYTGLNTTLHPYAVNIHHKVTAYRIRLYKNMGEEGSIPEGENLEKLEELWLGFDDDHKDDAINKLAYAALNKVEGEARDAAIAAIWWLAL